MADKWQTPNSWKHRSMTAARSHLVTGSVASEQPQSQPQPRAIPFNGVVQDSGSNTHQSHQLYQLPPHVQPHSRPQFQTLPQLQPYQASGSSLINKNRPNDGLNTILTDILEYLDQISVHQRLFNESMSKSDRCLEALVSTVSSISDTADGLTKKLEAQDEFLRKLERNSLGDDKRPKEIDVIKALVSEMKAFKKTLGKSCDGDDGRTVLGRLDAVTFAVGELLERARDPEANLPRPSAAPTIIDLTEASPPMRHTSPVQSRTYADVGTSLISSPLPLKEKSSALVQASTSPRSGFNSSGSFLQSSPAKSTPCSGRSSSGHSVKDPATSPDTRSTTLTQDNLELASPIPMDVDAADPTQSTIDVQILSTISMNNSDDVSRTQTNFQLSDRTAVHSSMPSDLTSAKVKTSQNITDLGASTHKNDKPPNSQSASLTAGPVPGISTFILPHTTTSAFISTASTSGASLAIAPTSFTQTEVQHPSDKAIAAITASGVANLGVSEGKQQHNKESQKQSPSTRDEETSLDNINSEGLIVGVDGKGYNEEIKAMKEELDRAEGKEKSGRIENELDENRKNDVPVSAPGPIDLSRHLRGRRSSPRFPSPSSSLPSRGKTGSRHSVPSKDVSYPSGLSSDTKLYSPTKTKVLVGVGPSRSPGLVASTASPSTAGITTRTPTTPIKKPTSVASSRSALRPTTANAELVVTPARPASMFTNPAVSPKRRITPALSESSHLQLASTSMPVMTNKPRPHSQTPTFPAAISSVPVPVISPTKNSNPATAIFNDFSPSQASTNVTQDEASVSGMVIEKENEGNEGGGEIDGKTGLKTASLKFAQKEEERSDGEDLAEKITGNFGLKTASHKFEEDEDEKQADHPPSSSSPSLFSSALPSSISGTPHRPVKVVSGPSTLRPQSFALLPDSPLASASRSNQTQNNKTPEPSGVFSLSPLPSVTCTPSTPSEVEASASTLMPTQNRASIEMLLPLDLSPIPDVEDETRKVEGTEKIRMEKLYTSLGDDADIVRAKKRKVSEGSGMIDKSSKSLVAKGKEKAKKEEIDGLETKSGEPAKKQSLFSLKAGRKGDSVAATRVKKRKARPDFIVDGEANGEGQHNDGLDEEKPLKRARQRVSVRQTKMEPLKKGKQLSREFSGSSFGAETSTRVMKPRSASVKKGPPSKGRLSVNRSHQGAEVEWPTMTKGDKSEDLVGCDKCTAWYHYGCVGLITAGDKRLQGGKKFFCPPCEAGTSIKKLKMDTECWRPGCSVPSGFIVEKIIGRFKKFVGKQGLEFKYLLQWKGYDISESSWEPEESMFDPPFMIEKFRVDALEEGIDVDKDKPGLILLRVAKDSCVPPPT